MPMPTDVPIIDCMIGFPANDFSQYEFILKQLKDSQSRDSFDFPVEYMFKRCRKRSTGRRTRSTSRSTRWIASASRRG